VTLPRLRADAARYGWFAALRAAAFGWLARRGVEINFIQSRPLVAVPSPFEEDGIVYRLVTPEVLYAQAQRPELDLNPAFLRHALGQGDYCCGAFDGDRLVSYVWRSAVGAAHVRGIEVRAAPTCRYGYKAFTLPAYRGRGIYPRIAPLADAAFLEQGKTHAAAFTAAQNLASLQSDKKIGNSVVGYAGYVRIGSLCIPFHSPGVKRRALRFVRATGG
jgi:hypothetical protein